MLHVVDTGEGQAIILDSGEVEILIDGGESLTSLRDYLDRTGIVDGPIELMVVSHTDVDAYLGFTAVLAKIRQYAAAMPVRELWLPGEYRTEQEIRAEAAGKRTNCRLSRPYVSFLGAIPRDVAVRSLPEAHVPALVSGKLAEFQIAGVKDVHFTVLSAGQSGSGTDRQCARRRNNASAVLLLRVGETRILFGGDVYGRDRPEEGPPAWVEAALLKLNAKHPGTLAADILIAPRRGSELASTPEYIAAIEPEFVLFGSSVRFLHPRPEVLERYRKDGRRMFQTRLSAAADRDHISCELGPPIDCRYSAHDGRGFEWSGRTSGGEELSDWRARMQIRELVMPGVRSGEKTQDAIARHDRNALIGADLAGLHWPNCEVGIALLARVSFRGAELSGCQFSGTDLSDADFSGAILTNVEFREANLDGADFSQADLRGARLIDSTMNRALLRGADIEGVVFEPIRWSLRNPQDLRRSPQLATLRYETSPHALYELRADLKTSGLRRAEREVTYVIESSTTAQTGGIEGWLRWLAFDVTSEYGRRPGRPLLVMLSLIPLFALLYWLPVRRETAAGIYRVPPEKKSALPNEITDPQRVQARGIAALGLALQFSVLSAFHIGWRELNVGNWISRMQPRNYCGCALSI